MMRELFRLVTVLNIQSIGRIFWFAYAHNTGFSVAKSPVLTVFPPIVVIFVSSFWVYNACQLYRQPQSPLHRPLGFHRNSPWTQRRILLKPICRNRFGNLRSNALRYNVRNTHWSFVWISRGSFWRNTRKFPCRNFLENSWKNRWKKYTYPTNPIRFIWKIT